MKIFTSTQLHKNSQAIYKIVDREGEVLINHARYPDVIFTLAARPRRKENLHEFMAKYGQKKEEK